jgi:hypothetical protein
MTTPCPLKNDDGYLTIVAALVILALLTVIGISASRVARTEATMARNEVIYKRNFYLAEGAALEAADRLTKKGNLGDNSEAWMEMVTGNLETDSLKYYWDNSVAAGDTVIPEPSTVDLDHTRFLAGHDGVAPGSSLDMSKPTIHAIAVYGRCVWEGTAIVKMGYRAAY